MPIAWRVRVDRPVDPRQPVPAAGENGVDQSFANGFTEEMAYAVPNYEVGYAMRTTHVPVGFWRSVNHSQNGFFRECFIDEMAHAAGQDPYQYRRKLIEQGSGAPRRARRGGAKGRLGERRRRRASPAASLSSRPTAASCAQVAEASVGDKGEVRRAARRLGDRPRPCRQPGDPAGAGRKRDRLRPDRGALRRRSRSRTAASSKAISTITKCCGSPTCRPSRRCWCRAAASGAAAASRRCRRSRRRLCNAIFAATGKRVRSLPLKDQDLKQVKRPYSALFTTPFAR